MLEKLAIHSLEEGARLHKIMAVTMIYDIVTAATMIAQAFKNGQKLLIFGNGGSAADAQHIAAEFVGRFITERQPLPAIALTTDTSILTAVANDYSYGEVFARQVKAIGKKGDVSLGITTSGNSISVLKALQASQTMGITTISMTGEKGRTPISGVSLRVPSRSTPRIQEAHIAIGHILCEMVDAILLGGHS